MADPPSLDELRELNRLATTVNENLDAMFVKLGKIVVAAEVAKETLGGLTGRESNEPPLSPADNQPQSGVNADSVGRSLP